MHTLTPWDKGDRYNRGDGIIFGFNCIPVLIYDRLTKDEDIDYILHCVNNHENLVEALNKAVTALIAITNDPVVTFTIWKSVIEECQQALSKAQGGE